MVCSTSTSNHSTRQYMPLPELILKTSYHMLKQPITLLGVSPISPIVVESALLAAKEAAAPIVFIASLNQVDIDGGYTGWTPDTFVRYVRDVVRRLNVNVPVIISLDHGGPWLNDRHIIEGYDLDKAMEATKKSIEAAIQAGYDLIHIDTTVDPHNPNLDPETVARRTLELLDYAEEIRRSLGRKPINYEIGSDRWVYRDVEYINELIRYVVKGIKERGLNEARILFVVGDVGTKVSPMNRLDVCKASQLVQLASTYGLFLKVHSADYVANPTEFPRLGIGGANIGPMYADLMYRVVKKLASMEKDLARRGVITHTSRIENVLYEEVLKDGRWRKYTKNPEKLREDEFLMGICTRYVWCNSRVDEALKELFTNLEKIGIDSRGTIVNELKNSIKYYMKSFNLEGLTTRIRVGDLYEGK
ncbi:MAG: hypothetical protein DRJ40_00705 [Thermoprotei archaeon]|nr:MAG: hypothetical protein DRJ40_00705 [Thermoprotei archaeon]